MERMEMEIDIVSLIPIGEDKRITAADIKRLTNKEYIFIISASYF